MAEAGLTPLELQRVPRTQSQPEMRAPYKGKLLNKVKDAVGGLPSLPDQLNLDWIDPTGKLPPIESIPDMVTPHPEQSLRSAMVEGAIQYFLPSLAAVRAHMERTGNYVPVGTQFAAVAKDAYDTFLSPLLTTTAGPMYAQEISSRLKFAATPPTAM